MFSIFKKKFFLRDLLHNAVDIHNHILPGIDDGAAELEDSLTLLQKFQELGVQHFIATPHIMNDYYPNTPETIDAALHKLINYLKEKGQTEIKIHAAAEYMMDHAFMETMDRENLLCLYQDLVLVEMSYFQAPINLNEILFKLQTNKNKPVLAHPERYAYFHSRKLDKYKELKQRGCLFQMNMLSILGHYGSHIQTAVFDLLDHNLIDFVGTDTHQLRHLEKISEAKIPEKRYNQLKPILENTRRTFLPNFSS